ncbi:hypothetical protein [Elongatibacter sediminis]|uniref:DUF932 domain-containing protein n=1 Tax=Elongatibacter sediminis TaxID=3119006 RepID=A0AAW9RJ29_9GAMM
MSLMLHRGAEEVSLSQLQQAFTPEATRTHVPIAHHSLVDHVRYALGMFGHVVAEEHHGITPDGMRYFGVLTLKSEYGDYTDTVGLRNSHDKRFPIGISMGARVFVCDNLSFMGEHVIRRKHTANAKRELPGLVMEIVEPLAGARQEQQITFDRYKATNIPLELASHAMIEMFRQGVMNWTRIRDVQSEWHEPSFEGFEDYTAWRLFNAATRALEGTITENPQTTQKLHEVIDGVCSRVSH